MMISQTSYKSLNMQSHFQSLYKHIYETQKQSSSDEDQTSNIQSYLNNESDHIITNQNQSQCSTSQINYSKLLSGAMDQSLRYSVNLNKIMQHPLQVITNKSTRSDLFKIVQVLMQYNKVLKSKIQQNGVNKKIFQKSMDNKAEAQQLLFEHKEQALIQEHKIKKQIQQKQKLLYIDNISSLRRKIRQKKQELQALQYKNRMCQESLATMKKKWEKNVSEVINAQKRKILLIQQKKKNKDEDQSYSKIQLLLEQYLDTLNKAMKEEITQSRFLKKTFQFNQHYQDTSQYLAVNPVYPMLKSEQSDSNCTLSPNSCIDGQLQSMKKIPELKKKTSSRGSKGSINSKKPPRSISPGSKMKIFKDERLSFKQEQLMSELPKKKRSFQSGADIFNTSTRHRKTHKVNKILDFE